MSLKRLLRKGERLEIALHLSSLRKGARNESSSRALTVRGYSTLRVKLLWSTQRYLLTFEKGLFLYLYLLLDEYSRKAIHWLISWRERAHEAKQLIEGGLLSENILDLPETERPEIVNDRSSQMRAKPIKKMFETHQMPQIFARPKTPNDNPFIESAFGTIKQSPRYPGRFLDQNDAIIYFDRFFLWYNTEHYHSGIDYVTPDQCHRGLKEKIVSERKAKRNRQQLLRKDVNRITTVLKNPLTNIYNNPINPMTCSVIPP